MKASNLSRAAGATYALDIHVAKFAGGGGVEGGEQPGPLLLF